MPPPKINPVKLKQDADKLEKAGRLDQAIAIYRQIVEDNPRDWNTVKKIGDLYVRLGKNKEAAAEYAKVADFYAKDGFVLKAIAVWKQINRLDTAALDPYVQLAELYAKQGLMKDALSHYQVVVEEYLKRGRTREAADVLKKMVDIDPSDLKTRSKLAELYLKDGNTAKAVDEYVAIADELHKKGHLAEALQVLEKGLKIDQRSPRLRMELARIHLVQKNYDKAAQFLEEAVQAAPGDAQILARLGEAYVGAKKLEMADGIFKRLLELNPDDQDARVQMGRVCLLQGQFDHAFDELSPVIEKLVARRDGDKAAALLQQIVQRNPGHVKSLLRLVEIYRVLQNEAQVVATYSQLVEAHLKDGRLDQAESVLAMLVEMEPYNEQHKTKLQHVRSRREAGRRPATVPQPPAPPPPTGAIDIDFENPPAEPERPAPPPLPEPQPAVTAGEAAGVRPRIELSQPLSDEEKEFVEEHLNEGKVFKKYGLVDKAIEQFEAVVARFPDNVEARQELRDVYRERGQTAKAAEHCLALAEIYRLKDLPGAEQFEAEALELAPGLAAELGTPAPEAAVPVEEMDVEVVDEGEAPDFGAPLPPVPEAPAEASAATGESDVEIPLSFDDEPAGGDELSLPSEPQPGFGMEAEPAERAELPFGDASVESGMAAETGASSAEDELPQLSEDLELSPMEELPLEGEPTLGPAPTQDGGLDLDSELSLDPGMDLGLSAEPPPPPPPVVTPKPPVTLRQGASPGMPPVRSQPAAPPAEESVPAELRRVLDEVSDFMSLGFVDDAKEALREVVQRYPAHPAILARLAELGFDREVLQVAPATAPKAQPPVSPPPPPSVEEPLPSLEDALADLTPPEPVEAAPASDAGIDISELAEPEAPAGGSIEDELSSLFEAQPAVQEAPAAPEQAGILDASLAEVFREFKKGVDKQLGKEDYDTRYNLGIAYKEMGLIDEAIAEFQLAAKDEGRLLECSSMLGICFMEKGMPQLAIKWFEKGLQAQGRTDEEYLGLRYDLALAYEAAGQIDKALALYTDLYGQDATFRDVAVKVRELAQAQGRAS